MCWAFPGSKSIGLWSVQKTDDARPNTFSAGSLGSADPVIENSFFEPFGYCPG